MSEKGGGRGGRRQGWEEEEEEEEEKEEEEDEDKERRRNGKSGAGENGKDQEDLGLVRAGRALLSRFHYSINSTRASLPP